MTQYLETLEIGSKVKMTGPKGSLKYYGGSYFEYKEKLSGDIVKTTRSKIGMIAGGTGITPLIQII